MCEEDWSNSPEADADWLAWYDSLEPLEFTPEERADVVQWRQKLNELGCVPPTKYSGQNGINGHRPVRNGGLGVGRLASTKDFRLIGRIESILRMRSPMGSTSHTTRVPASK
jgi:hypothetical protein